MEPMHFDHFARAISRATSRRVLLERITAAALVAGLARFGTSPDGADARKKHKKKRRCPKDRRCGKKRCCNRGQLCAGGVCVTGQGSCPAGTSSCEAGALILCNDSCICATTMQGATRCAQAGDGAPVGPCGGCTSDADCASFGAGAFCIAAGIGCGCQAGEGICATPCLN